MFFAAIEVVARPEALDFQLFFTHGQLHLQELPCLALDGCFLQDLLGGSILVTI